MSVEDQINNYYEHKVVQEIYDTTQDLPTDRMADIACVALNRLPPKYFRYEVDMAFYISPLEAEEMQAKVRQAVKEAIVFVEEQDRLRQESES